jgi:exportin-T
MEITVRYSTVLVVQPDLIPPVLEFFVGHSGIHSSEARVQLRAWYLFSRLIGKIQKHAAPMSEQIIGAFTDLLEIRVKPALESGDTDSDTDSEQQDAFFDSQLYLFQSAGLLIASSRNNNLAVGQALLQSLTANIDECIQAATANQAVILNVHHSIMAIGDIAKGFEGASDITASTRQGAGTQLFTAPSETILKGLERLEESVSIRDAVRFPNDRFEFG